MHCVVVDNTPDGKSAAALGLSPEVGFLPNGANVGIATALNQGVEALLRAGFEMAILFDQDSEPPLALLRELPEILVQEEAAGKRVALVGPAYDDPRLRGVAPFVRFGWWKLKRIEPAGHDPVDVDFLISSGSCVNLRHWNEIGPMDDALFIDFVDLEWCVRARHKGFHVLGIPWVRMTHELGGEPVKVLGRSYPMHGPIRHYYQFRNVIALIRRPDMPITWKSTELIKLPVRMFIYCMWPSERARHLIMALRGLRDGWRGRLGSYDDRRI
jgi:rhamnosyltransferase